MQSKLIVEAALVNRMRTQCCNSWCASNVERIFGKDYVFQSFLDITSTI
jgi:hypothetical protein